MRPGDGVAEGLDDGVAAGASEGERACPRVGDGEGPVSTIGAHAPRKTSTRTSLITELP
jgi:hypothetical protein